MITPDPTLIGLPDLQFMPIAENKLPIAKGWQNTKADYEYHNAKGIGLVCGKLSGNLEAIDIDCKYDLTGKLFEKYKNAINAVDKSILKKLVVQETVSKGFHFIYRCEQIEGNKKLARREAVDQEKLKGDKVKVLIETRGEGGYIAVVPTKGYRIIYGSLSEIQTLTIDERDVLMSVAREFNECLEELKPANREKKKQIKGLTPFEDFNERGDVVALLESHGWKFVKKKGSKNLMLRPGQTTSVTSGNFDESNNWFSVFSTSTEFDTDKAYLPYAVYATLETKGDFTEASRRLYHEGYGDRFEKAQDNSSKTPSRIDTVNDDYSFLATPADYDDYLDKWRKGTFEMGLPTGFKDLDKYFVFKPGNLVVINGHDNVGKSTVIWYMALVSAMLHGWNWIIFSSENTIGSLVKKLIEFYWCEPIESMNDQKFKIAKTFIEKHFAILKSDNELYNYQDILNMAKKLMKKGTFNSILIDPYNSLKIELTNSSKLSTHEYHYEAISEIKLFTKQTKISVYINCHAVTKALREVGGDKMATAPQKADTEGGGKFSNKADDFITIHRKVQSRDEWMFTELHIRKIKETETGGRVTPFDSPVRIRMVRGLVGFELENEAGIIENPIEAHHKKPIKLAEFPEQSFRPIITESF